MVDPWLLIFEIVYIGSIPFSILSLLILRLTLDRRVRKILPADKDYSSPLDWNFGFMRVIGFSYAAISKWANNSYVMRDYYDGINVKELSSMFEKTLSYVFVLSMSVLFLCTFFFLVTKYFGILDWPEPVALHH